MEKKAEKNVDKKMEEQRKLKELEDARREAFKDRQQMQAKVKARLYEEDPRRLADEQEQAERRRFLED